MRLRSADDVKCPNCGSADEVEDSVNSAVWDGYCYACNAPFVVLKEEGSSE